MEIIGHARDANSEGNHQGKEDNKKEAAKEGVKNIDLTKLNSLNDIDGHLVP